MPTWDPQVATSSNQDPVLTPAWQAIVDRLREVIPCDPKLPTPPPVSGPTVSQEPTPAPEVSEKKTAEKGSQAPARKDEATSSSASKEPKDMADLTGGFWLCPECLNFWGALQTKYVQQYLREKNAQMAERQVFSQRFSKRCPCCNGVRQTYVLFLDGEETHQWEEFSGDTDLGWHWVYLGAQFLRLHPDAALYPGLEVSLKPLKDGYTPMRVFEIVPDDPDFPGRPSSRNFPESTQRDLTLECMARQKKDNRGRPSFFDTPPMLLNTPTRSGYTNPSGKGKGPAGPPTPCLRSQAGEQHHTNTQKSAGKGKGKGGKGGMSGWNGKGGRGFSPMGRSDNYVPIPEGQRWWGEDPPMSSAYGSNSHWASWEPSGPTRGKGCAFEAPLPTSSWESPMATGRSPGKGCAFEAPLPTSHWESPAPTGQAQQGKGRAFEAPLPANGSRSQGNWGPRSRGPINPTPAKDADPRSAFAAFPPLFWEWG